MREQHKLEIEESRPNIAVRFDRTCWIVTLKSKYYIQVILFFAAL